MSGCHAPCGAATISRFPSGWLAEPLLSGAAVCGPLRCRARWPRSVARDSSRVSEPRAALCVDPLAAATGKRAPHTTIIVSAGFCTLEWPYSNHFCIPLHFAPSHFPFPLSSSARSVQQLASASLARSHCILNPFIGFLGASLCPIPLLTSPFLCLQHTSFCTFFHIAYCIWKGLPNAYRAFTFLLQGLEHQFFLKTYRF